MGGRPRSGPKLSSDLRSDSERELVGIELVRVSLPVNKGWASAAGTFTWRDSLLVRAVLSVHNGAGNCESEGWGECGALPGPTYSPEYTAGALEVALNYLIPALFRGGAARAEDVAGALGAVAGHRMAKSALEAALLDAELRVAGQSMASFFASLSHGNEPQRQDVAAGVAVGLCESSEELLDEVGHWVAEGYRRVKVKIAPGNDVKPVAAVRERWPELILVADANGSYRRLPPAEAAASLRALEPFGLACLEQPLAEEDLLGHAELARLVKVPICLDEPLTSLYTVAIALELAACSVVNIKAGRLGGYLEAVRVHDLCAERQVPVWCGGMVETGIARAANVALAALPNFSLPGDLSATGRFFEKDLTSPLPLQPGGTIAVPDGAGSGVSVDTAAVDAFATWRRWCPAGG